MSEKSMRRAVVRMLAGYAPVSVENVAHPGTPDVSYVEGWIELKSIDAWPRRATTPVTLAHFTLQQRAWLAARCRAGGRAHLLLRVANREWLLFQGYVAAAKVGRVPQDQLRAIAVQCWSSAPTPLELANALRLSPRSVVESKDLLAQASS